MTDIQVPDTLDDIVSRMSTIQPEYLALADNTELDEAGIARFRALDAEWDALDGARQSAQEAAEQAAHVERVRRFAAAPGARESLADTFERDPLGDAGDNHVERNENPWDLEQISRSSTSDLVARALSAAELTPGPGDGRRQALTEMIEQSDHPSTLSRMVLLTTSPAYKAAYGKVARVDGDVSRARLSDAEMAAIDAANGLREEVSRAMSINTGASSAGLLVPTDIEPAVTMTSDGTANVLYNLARREQTVSTEYRVVGSPNAVWSWDGENTEVSDDSPTTTNTDIALEIAQGFVPWSIATEQAVPNITAQVARVLSAGWDDLLGAALTTGTGSDQPTGIVTALTGTGSVVASAGTDTLAVGDIYAVRDALPRRHRRNATWIMAVETMSAIRQFATDDGHALLARLGDGDPERLLGRPYEENEDMDGTITGSSDNYLAILGDFEHFVIAEAVGMLTEFVPQTFGSNGRPTGGRGIFAQTRLGADSVLDGAFRMLNVT